jgi:hypothetical protein
VTASARLGPVPWGCIDPQDRPLVQREIHAARIEKRLGRNLTAAESFRAWSIKTSPDRIGRRGEYHADGYRLVVCGRGGPRASLEMARLGRLWNGAKVKA